MPALTCALIGTDTGVGKSWVTAVLTHGLRALGRHVWIHKPVACGGWQDESAEDGRWLQTLLGDGQPARTVCPRQFPDACAPHLAAHARGVSLTLAELALNVERARPRHGADFLVEGIGGLLVPLTDERETVADLCLVTQLPVVIVARTQLGTLNHTALTVEVARSRGLDILGIILNDQTPPVDSVATRTAAHELTALTHTPVLGHVRHQETHHAALATTLLACL